MPCYLGLSVANARVADEAIARLLTPEVAERIVSAYLKQKGLLHAPVIAQGGSVRAYLPNGTAIRVEGGVVDVESNSRGYARQFTDELTAALTAAGEALFAAKVQAALGRLAPGRRVYARSVEVEEGGARARATILTLNL